MIYDGMVDGEDNPELIEKILVMHGKQQQKQQEDLDDAADAEGWIDVCKETDAQHRKIMEKLQENEKSKIQFKIIFGVDQVGQK